MFVGISADYFGNSSTDLFRNPFKNFLEFSLKLLLEFLLKFLIVSFLGIDIFFRYIPRHSSKSSSRENLRNFCLEIPPENVQVFVLGIFKVLARCF